METTQDRDYYPEGWRHNPSAPSHRWYIGILAAAGFVVSAFMALYEWGRIGAIWEPLFPGGSQFILHHSSITIYFLQTFGFPDAFFGAAIYLAEMLMAGWEGPARWRTTPWIPVAQGLLALLMAAASVILILAQALVYHHWCTLCLVSALISFLIVGPAVHELWAAARYLWRRPRPDVSRWYSFWGTAH